MYLRYTRMALDTRQKKTVSLTVKVVKLLECIIQHKIIHLMNVNETTTKLAFNSKHLLECFNDRTQTCDSYMEIDVKAFDTVSHQILQFKFKQVK